MGAQCDGTQLLPVRMPINTLRENYVQILNKSSILIKQAKHCHQCIRRFIIQHYKGPTKPGNNKKRTV